jgi:hypothetical protein
MALPATVENVRLRGEMADLRPCAAQTVGIPTSHARVLASVVGSAFLGAHCATLGIKSGRDMSTHFKGGAPVRAGGRPP